MSVVDMLFDLPTVLANFGSTLIEVLTTEVTLFDWTISLWQIIAGASAAIVLGLVVYSIVTN